MNIIVYLKKVVKFFKKLLLIFFIGSLVSVGVILGPVLLTAMGSPKAVVAVVILWPV
jgi:hypothetical protein